MQERSAPYRCNVPAQANAADDVFERAARAPGHVSFARKNGSGWTPVTSAAELTPTQKVRRSYVLAKFESDVRELYRRPGLERSALSGAA